MLVYRTLLILAALSISCSGSLRGDGHAAVCSLVAESCRLNGPFGVDFDRSGNMYVVEMLGNKIDRIDRKMVSCTALAGTGEKGDSGDGESASHAKLNGPHNLLVGPNGDIYVADTWNNRVRRVDHKTGLISTVVGTGEHGFDGDGGPATKARFGAIYCLAFDRRRETLYLDDLDNRRIRAVDMRTGIVRTVAGNGQKGIPSDGAKATEAALVDPRAIAMDSKGNLYILERSGNALRVVDSEGRIRTVAGTGKPGGSGDGGAAVQATLNGPKHLCIDRNDSVLIADTENHVLRRYSPSDGTIRRVAGTGAPGSGGIGGPPEYLELHQPHGVCVHRLGDIYIADSLNHRVIRIHR